MVGVAGRPVKRAANSLPGLLPRLAQDAQDHCERKPAPLQETHLAGLFPLVRRRHAKPLQPEAASGGKIVQPGRGQRAICDFVLNAPPAQFARKPRPSQPTGARPNQRLGRTLVRQQPQLRQIVQQRRDLLTGLRLRGQLVAQFRAAVLPLCEQTQRAGAKLGR